MSAIIAGAADDRPIYTFTLPFPPSLNHYLRRTSRGVYQTAEARAYKTAAGALAMRAGVQPLQGAIAVALDVYRPTRRGDLDNYSKVLLDALNGIAWGDNSQVVEIHLRRFESPKQGRVEVAIWQQQ